MKNPLHYQISEYDCGPTSLLNALSFLFEREQIPPEVIRNIMLYSLDCYDGNGISGKSGTSRTAMMFLSNWLNSFGQIGQLSITSRYLSGESVHLRPSSAIRDALRRGGAAVVRLNLEGDHYVTFTGLDGEDGICLFDPYCQPAESFPATADTDASGNSDTFGNSGDAVRRECPDGRGYAASSVCPAGCAPDVIRLVFDRPTACNRIVSGAYMDTEEARPYALGAGASREAVLLFNRDTMLTPEKTIEYFI